jgi:hypothetical protein
MRSEPFAGNSKEPIVKRTGLTVIAMCATLLWAGAVYASNAGGLPACQASLSTETGLYNTCQASLTTAQLCGNAAIDAGEQCDQGNLDGQTCATQGYVGGTLKCGSGCMFDTSGCTNTRYTDNSDGTVTDNKTGLMWEQTTGTVGGANTGKVNDVNNTYSWSTGDDLADGTAFTSFLATLNYSDSCFATHCDWRLPSIGELQGIVDPSAPGCGSTGPCIDQTKFGPTQFFSYWSATNLAGFPSEAYTVYFPTGSVGHNPKTDGNKYVRAVRSGM